MVTEQKYKNETQVARIVSAVLINRFNPTRSIPKDKKLKQK